MMFNLARLLMFAAVLAALPAKAELIFSAPPRETAAEAEATYGPLVKKLSAVLGDQVVYQAPINWGDYSNKMRAGKYDLVLDGPHLASWRIHHRQHRAVARLPGSLRFVTVTEDEHSHGNILDIAHHRICSTPSPNLATVSLLSEFNVTVPEIVGTKTDTDEAFKALKDNRCDAVVLRDVYYDTVPEADRKGLKIIHTSPTFPNQVFTAGPKVDAAKLDALRGMLTGEDAALKPVLERFAPKEGSTLLAAGDEEFKDYSKLLEGVVWGW